MIKKTLKILPVFFIIFFLSTDKPVYTYKAKNSSKNLVRVAVIKNADEVSLKIKSPYRIYTLKTNQLIAESHWLKGVEVLPTMSGILLGEKEYKIYGIKIVPKRDSSVYINKRRFRGVIDIIRDENIALLVVNHIDIEDYLRGVLYNEVSHWWPIEALRVQAIAARTYALYQRSVSSERDYDLSSDVSSQVYGGKFSERWRTDRAVRLTKGEVLTYNGRIFPSFYHATCGGHTEDASNLWNVDIEPLKGTKCNFCRISPHYHWRKEIMFRDLKEKLGKAGFKIGNITSLETMGRFDSGRIKDIEVKSRDAALTIRAKDFRNALGNNFLRSTNFKISIDGYKVIFEGLGWGHGVGMCQWGAYSMAKRHYKANEILHFYYPGTEIEDY